LENIGANKETIRIHNLQLILGDLAIMIL